MGDSGAGRILETQVNTEKSALAFGEKLLALIDRGSFIATYKYAVLLGLIDLCIEKTRADGGGPSSVTTRELAEKVSALYWPQTRVFPKTGRVLNQNMPQHDKRGQAEIVTKIEQLRIAFPAASTVHRARVLIPSEWKTLVDEVEWKLIEMPLPRLQTIGALSTPFIYVISWDKRVRRSDFRRSTFDNVIRFQPGAAEALVRLAGLLRPLVQREWSMLI